jgi:hypothetical protein
MGMFDGLPPEGDLFGRILSDRRPLTLLVVDDEPLAKVIGDVMEYMDFKVVRWGPAKCAITTQSMPRAHLIIVNVSSSQLTRCGLPPEVCDNLPNEPVVVCGSLDKPYLECHCHAFFLKVPFNVGQFAYALDAAMSLVYLRGFSSLKRANYRRSEPIGDAEPDPSCPRLPPRAQKEITGHLRLIDPSAASWRKNAR